MKGIYLGACRAYLPNYDLDYNDIVSGYHVNIVCDMLDVDLSIYDYLIATPPCNWYSRANYRRDVSLYALSTKHLLPSVLKKFVISGKPFIIENVRNFNLFSKCGIIDFCSKNGIFVYEFGRHTYFTNIMMNLNNLPQIKDNIQNTNNTRTTYREGGYNVNLVISYFIDLLL